jgi:hypothetical protein
MSVLYVRGWQSTRDLNLCARLKMMNSHGVQMSFQRRLCISGIAEVIQASQAVSSCEFLPTTINLKKARRLASKIRSPAACTHSQGIMQLTSDNPWPHSSGSPCPPFPSSWLHFSPEMGKSKGIAKKEAAKDKKQSCQPEGLTSIIENRITD